MNILFICDEYPPGKIGGIGTMVQVLSRELVKQGHNIFVVGLYTHSFGGLDFEEDQGVKVWRMRYGLNLRLNEYHFVHKAINKIPDFIKKHLNGKTAFNRFISFIDSLVDQKSIEIIEIPDWNTFAMRIGFLVKWPSFKVPLVLKSHGSYTYLMDELKKPVKKNLFEMDKELYKRADAICAVSLYAATRGKVLFNYTKNIKVLYNAIEDSKESCTQIREVSKVIFTGTLIEIKGIFQLVRAWNIVNQKIPQAQLMVFGKGDPTVLKKMLTKDSLKTVTFAGHVKRENLFGELSRATVSIFPSLSETFGLGVIEAMSVGCPVIFTKRASGPEIIDDKINGELVEPSNIDEIAHSIINIISNKDLQWRYSCNGKETVATKFNITNSAKEHIIFYNDIIQQFKQKNQ